MRIFGSLRIIIYLSGNNCKCICEVVEEVTGSTSPVVESMSTLRQSNESQYRLQGDEDTLVENVTFVDEVVTPTETAPVSVNPVAMVDSTPDLHLGSFLSRPVTIDTFTWSAADPLGPVRTIAPWQLYMNQSVAKSKLNNYAFMRAKLHLKVVINATPFQYGCLRAAYYPMSGWAADKVRLPPGSAEPTLIPYSQQLGDYILPHENKGCEFEVPFIYHQNWLDITSNDDVTNFGRMRFIVYAPFAGALPTTPTTITVRTLAWLSDVELMGTTKKLALQGDEYGTGSISKPASAVANVASMLTHVPVIGPFARATQIGASAVGKIASLFGFTNVPNIETVSPMYPMSAPQLATAEISVPYQKLAYDPKTELSIDPTLFSDDSEDMLALSSLKKRESYFGQTTWSTSQAEGTLLMAANITPNLRDSVFLVNTINRGLRYYMTPLAYYGCMFKNWRGSIKIRVRVIATKYHKGRLKISWDPTFNVSTSEALLNEAYTKIVDIGETRDFTLEIPYHQATSWLNVSQNSVTNNWSRTGATTLTPGEHNGTLAVRVYNSLEAPNTGSISLLFSVWGGDDFEFANPKSSINTGTEVQDCPIPSFFQLQGEELHFGESKEASEDRYGLNFGEAVMSLRKVMRRSTVVDTVPLPVGTASAYNIYRKGYLRMPYTPGYTPVSMGANANRVMAPGSASYAFNTMHPLPWISGPFLGYRGSTNFAVTVNSPKVSMDDIRVVRGTDANVVTGTNRLISLVATILGSASFSVKCSRLGSFWNSRDGNSGLAVSSSSTNPTLLFTLPDYNRFNFSLVDPAYYIAGSLLDGSADTGCQLTIPVANTTATDELGYSTIQTAVGAGADFTVVRFICVPTIDAAFGYADPVT